MDEFFKELGISALINIGKYILAIALIAFGAYLAFLYLEEKKAEREDTQNGRSGEDD